MTYVSLVGKSVNSGDWNWWIPKWKKDQLARF